MDDAGEHREGGDTHGSPDEEGGFEGGSFFWEEATEAMEPESQSASE